MSWSKCSGNLRRSLVSCPEALPNFVSRLPASLSQMNDLLEQLCGAAFRGELPQVKKSLEHLDIRTFVNAPNSRGKTTIFFSPINFSGQTALYCAARNGHVPVVLELLNFAGIDPSIQVPEHGATPGHGGWALFILTEFLAAAFGPHPEVLALLIAHGVDMSIRNKHDLTPRQEARKQCIDVFKLYETGKTVPFISKMGRWNWKVEGKIPNCRTT